MWYLRKYHASYDWLAHPSATAVLEYYGCTNTTDPTTTKVSNEILSALATCVNLRGLMIVLPYNQHDKEDLAAAAEGKPCKNSTPATDAGLAAVLRCNPKLTWIMVTTHTGGSLFGEACWEALREGACPDLTVLWCNAHCPDSDMIGRTMAAPDTVRAALAAPGMARLKLAMINPDIKLVSRWVRGGTGKKADRLDGDKPKPRPSSYW